MFENVGDEQQGCAVVIALASRKWIVCAVKAALLKDRELFELTSFVSEQKNRHAGDVNCKVNLLRCVMIGRYVGVVFLCCWLAFEWSRVASFWCYALIGKARPGNHAVSFARADWHVTVLITS